LFPVWRGFLVERRTNGRRSAGCTQLHKESRGGKESARVERTGSGLTMLSGQYDSIRTWGPVKVREGDEVIQAQLGTLPLLRDRDLRNREESGKTLGKKNGN